MLHWFLRIIEWIIVNTVTINIILTHTIRVCVCLSKILLSSYFTKHSIILHFYNQSLNPYNIILIKNSLTLITLCSRKSFQCQVISGLCELQLRIFLFSLLLFACYIYIPNEQTTDIGFLSGRISNNICTLKVWIQ